MRHKVLYASRYDFTNRETRELVQGCKVTYLDNSNQDHPDRRGRPALTLACELEIFDKLPVLPAEYDLDFTMRPDSKGRPVLSIADVHQPQSS